MSSVTIATQVNEDDNLVQEFEEYCERNSMQSKSEGVRTLIREGLEESDEDEEGETSSQDTQTRRATTPLQDALAEAGLLDRRFFGYAIFGVIAQDIYQLMVDVGTFFVSIGTVNVLFTSVALLITSMFTLDYVVAPLLSFIKESTEPEPKDTVED